MVDAVLRSAAKAASNVAAFTDVKQCVIILGGHATDEAGASFAMGPAA